MSGPVAHVGAPKIEAQADAELNNATGWDWFKNQFVPAVVADTFKPDDALLVELARYSETEMGARIVAWLHDLTDRAPYPQTIGTIEQTALAAAKHQGRAGVGHVIGNAIAEGHKLRNQKKG